MFDFSGDDVFKQLNTVFPDNTNMLMEKGIYPYDYAKSYSVFSETEFPPRSAFFNQLRDENVTESDYQRGLQIFRTFDCETLEDYMLLYVKTDTS